MGDILLYFFMVRGALSGKWRQTRYRLNEDEARARYGDGKRPLTCSAFRDLERAQTRRLAGEAHRRRTQRVADAVAHVR